VLTGGFPCQPYSLAGKRKGKEDERHLWPEMLRAIGEIQPRWIVGENVPGIINWSGGLVFHEVQTDLEVKGYEVFPIVLPACSVGAPHRRDRTWFIANSISTRKWELLPTIERDNTSKIGGKNSCRLKEFISEGSFTDSLRIRQSRQGRPKEQMRSETYRNREASWTKSDGGWPTQSPVCRRNDGISYRMDRLKSLGNAIVPQVAYQIFKAINEYELCLNTSSK
jgi:DNA (cytosine-5)-methyltransferase 1